MRASRQGLQRSLQPQSNTPGVTALAVPTEGSWAAVGIPLVQMRKLKLERGGLTVSPGAEIIGWDPEFQPLRLLLSTLHFLGLNNSLCKNLCFHLWLLLAWAHSNLPQGGEPCALPFPATGPLPGALFPGSSSHPSGSAQASPPSSPF